MDFRAPFRVCQVGNPTGDLPEDVHAAITIQRVGNNKHAVRRNTSELRGEVSVDPERRSSLHTSHHHYASVMSGFARTSWRHVQDEHVLVPHTMKLVLETWR